MQARLASGAGCRFADPAGASRRCATPARGGKRLRAFLVLEGAALHGVPRDRALAAAAAVEALHAYRLVHDDLPCMDDDDLRRGQPTVHVKWDEATAVLAGDALQALAFELVAATPGRIRAGGAAGADPGSGTGGRAPTGMVRGQAQDIAAETAAAPLTLAEITDLQANKTGALIRWSAGAGRASWPAADPGPLRRYAARAGPRLPDRRRHPRRQGDPGGDRQAHCRRMPPPARPPSSRCSASTAPAPAPRTGGRGRGGARRPMGGGAEPCGRRRGSLSRREELAREASQMTDRPATPLLDRIQALRT